MWCCGESSAYAPSEGGGISSFPGQRRTYQQPSELYGQGQFGNTGGNALSAYDPSKHGGRQFVSVTVPEGVFSGQVLHVTAPDGSGRVVAAAVPAGMKPGQIFQVGFPSMSFPANNNNNFEEMANAPVPGEGRNDPIVTAVAVPLNQQYGNNAVVDHAPSPQQQYQQQIPYSQTMPASAMQSGDMNYKAQYSGTMSQGLMPGNSATQQYLLVQVPPGTPPGTTLNVQVPGENRILAAIVPPGVTQFHVAYTPNFQGASVVQGQSIQQNGGGQQSGGRWGYNNQNNNNNNQNHNWASYAPLIAAPLLMGAAGVAAYEMMSHGDDDRGYGGGGSGDYGGDFDDGGGFDE